MKLMVTGIVHDPDDSADALQNALLYIWKNLARIHRHPNPHGYILRICASSSRDVLRRRARRNRHEVRSEIEPAVSPPDPGRTEARRRALAVVRDAIAVLPAQQAQAVVLRLLEEEPFAAIGRALECSEVTARSHVSKGLDRLRRYLAEHGLEPGGGMM